MSRVRDPGLTEFRGGTERFLTQHGILREAARNEKQYVTDVAQVLRTIIT